MIKISMKLTSKYKEALEQLRTDTDTDLCTLGWVTYPEARITVPFSAITSTGGEFALKFKRFKLSNSI